MRRELLRILDANFNRSREGLRVCEEITRFILTSRALTSELRSVRHGISGIMRHFLVKPRLMAGSPAIKGMLLESRDSENDIGRPPRLNNQARQFDSGDIFISNIERVKESLRVLEEFFKLIDKKKARVFSNLRFKTYDIEKKVIKRIATLRNIK